MNIRIRPLGFVTVAAIIGLGLTSCAGVVPMKPAEDSNNPECANVTVRLPDTVSELTKRETNAQATGAWGTPAAVLLTCGVTVPGPTTLPCVSINDVDWIEDDSQAPLYRYTTYGRTPAVEVVIDSEAVSGTTTLVDLGPAVSVLPQTSQCTDITDVFSE
ncbi:DUF3515 domain-containing protein [Aurantimicrobium sp. MWH-Uga1]|uniref:DUF3515 domain-containing protein n=1 Tax=Aurantimicrobium sp. MWH-Uga1 TaxID=2079575 RepID=UPI000DF0B67B|nr:DUF3515 domain-containing protein [Aurantimicrobium sp. MWH-Uga1]AXE54760.1 hypothetical protein AURUGA1_01077 [Aurantimicrobium sp. MWH-Uga1]